MHSGHTPLHSFPSLGEALTLHQPFQFPSACVLMSLLKVTASLGLIKLSARILCFTPVSILMPPGIRAGPVEGGGVPGGDIPETQPHCLGPMAHSHPGAWRTAQDVLQINYKLSF